MTVLYCLVAGDIPAAIPGGGVPGAEPPRALPLPHGLTAIVATLPSGRFTPDTVTEKLRDMAWVSEAAIGHEKLLETMMRSAPAVLPMKLLTLFSGDSRLVKDLSARRKPLARAAARVAGCEEYGLRVVAIDTPGLDVPQGRPASGTAFLERKKQARDVSRDRTGRRAAFAREAFETLAKASRDAVARPPAADDAERPLVDAAFLVASDQKGGFGRASEKLAARAAAANCLFKLTGPWPPYHFVQVGDGA